MSEVCQHSGLPLESCDWGCVRCQHEYLGCPDRCEVYKSAATIRESWSDLQLDRAEGRNVIGEIPMVRRVTDHMVRRHTEGRD